MLRRLKMQDAGQNTGCVPGPEARMPGRDAAVAAALPPVRILPWESFMTVKRVHLRITEGYLSTACQVTGSWKTQI
jgi:hypothetical protein